MSQVILMLTKEDLQEMLDQAALKALKASQQSLPQLYDMSQLMQALRCSRQKVYSLISQGQLHPIKVGKSNQFNVEEIQSILNT